MRRLQQILGVFVWGVVLFSSVPGVADEPEGRVFYKDGLHVSSADENNVLILNGRLQSRFTYNAPNQAADSAQFTINRGELRFDGTVFSKKLIYGFEFGFATRPGATTGTGILNDFYMDWFASDAVGIKFGQFKVPFLYAELVSGMKQQFPDRSLAHDDFTMGRDLGVSLHGVLFNYYLAYNVFAMNGDGANNFNSNKGLLAGIRFDLPLLGDYKFTESDVDYSEEPQFLTGLAYVYNQRGSAIQNGSIPASIKTSHATLDAIFRSHGFSLQGAGMFSRTHQGAAIKNWGYNLQSGYFLIPKHLEVAGRFAGTVLGNAVADQKEYGGAINYYFNKHMLKLQTDYAYLKNGPGLGATAHRIRTQLTVVF